MAEKKNKIVLTVEDKDLDEGSVTVSVVFNGKSGISKTAPQTPALMLAFAMMDAARAEAEQTGTS